jgi:PAS domain S-box-containing protein
MDNKTRRAMGNTHLTALLRTLNSVESGVAKKLEGVPTRTLGRGLSDPLQTLSLTLEELRVVRDELVERSEELLADRERYHALFTHSPQAYVITDVDGNVRAANDAAARLLQWPGHLLLKKCLWAFVDAGDRKAFLRRFAFHTAGVWDGAPWQITLKTRRGGRVRVSLRLNDMVDDRLRVKRIYWSLTPLSEHPCEGQATTNTST